VVEIDAALVQKVAGLASLELSDAESTYALTHLGRILDYVAELERLPTDQLSALDDIAALPAIERSDEVGLSLSAEAAMANAPAHQATAFLVPRIIE
jgi:aspartyl-tRNA(Asn)/glutamyl-tRNA(Gln) amidotransferase subunit C